MNNLIKTLIIFLMLIGVIEIVHIINEKKIVEEITKVEFKLQNSFIKGKLYSQSEIETINKATQEKEQSNNMLIMQEAYKEAGFDPKKGKPTKEQREKIRAYMEKARFPIIKREILEESQGLPKLKQCLSDARSLRDVYVCDSDNDFEHWGKSEKEGAVKEIIEAEKRLPCVKKSQNMDELKTCFPKDDE